MCFYLSVVFDSNYKNKVDEKNIFLILSEDTPPNPPYVIAKISHSYNQNILIEKLHEKLPKMNQLCYPISKAELKSLINNANNHKVDDKDIHFKSIYELANTKHKHYSADIINIETKKFPENLLKQLGIELKFDSKTLESNKIIYPNLNVITEQYNSDDGNMEYQINQEQINFDKNIIASKKIIWENKPPFENRMISETTWSKEEIQEITSTIKYHTIKRLNLLKLNILEYIEKNKKHKIPKNTLKQIDSLDLSLKEFDEILRDIDLQINYTKDEIITCTMNNEIQEKKRLISELKLLKAERMEHMGEIDELYKLSNSIKSKISSIITDEQLKELLLFDDLNNFNMS